MTISSNNIYSRADVRNCLGWRCNYNQDADRWFTELCCSKRKKIAKYGANALTAGTQQSGAGDAYERVNRGSLMDRSFAFVRRSAGSSNSNKNQSSYSRVVLHRAFAYSSAFFLAWSFFAIGACFDIANMEWPTAIWYLTNIFNPLQGVSYSIKQYVRVFIALTLTTITQYLHSYSILWYSCIPKWPVQNTRGTTSLGARHLQKPSGPEKRMIALLLAKPEVDPRGAKRSRCLCQVELITLLVTMEASPRRTGHSLCLQRLKEKNLWLKLLKPSLIHTNCRFPAGTKLTHSTIIRHQIILHWTLVLRTILIMVSRDDYRCSRLYGRVSIFSRTYYRNKGTHMIYLELLQPSDNTMVWCGYTPLEWGPGPSLSLSLSENVESPGLGLG